TGSWMTTGAYTTTANNNIYGTLQDQLTVGVSYNRVYVEPEDQVNFPDVVFDDDNYGLLTVGGYTTYANIDNKGTVDGFGTVLQTITAGTSQRVDDTGSWMTTGAYTTTANNNIYGTLQDQLTVGESYNRVYVEPGDQAKFPGVVFDDDNYGLLTVGGYTTYANIDNKGTVDGFGTVLQTITAGTSRRVDDTGSWMTTGAYTTTANNNIYGTLINQLTVGESYNRIWDTTVSTPDVDIDGDGDLDGSYVLHTVGAYNTYANRNGLGRIDGFGTVLESITIGESYARGDPEKISGEYTTTSTNNVYGYLISQITVGRTYQKGDRNLMAGGYTTYANVDGLGTIDGFGTVRESVTLGESYARGDEDLVSGAYTTRATNNVYGYLTSQITIGESYHKGNRNLIASAYTTNANEIDGFGTVRRTTTAGESYARADRDLVSGIYTTTAENNVYGILQDQGTVGATFNNIGSTGIYTTTIIDIDRGWGIILQDQTVGTNLKEAQLTGGYTTDKSYTTDWGILSTQVTSGASHFKGRPDMARGTYVTTATVDETWGIVTETVTTGESFYKGDSGQISGTYATTTINDPDWGTMLSQSTTGNSYKGAQVVGNYETTAVNIDADFGILLETRTTGRNYNKEGNLSSEYTTSTYYDNTFGLTIGSLTAGESYHRFVAGEVTSRYTTVSQDEDYDGWGDLLTSETVTRSYKYGGLSGQSTSVTTYSDGITIFNRTQGTSYMRGLEVDEYLYAGEYTTENSYDEWGELTGYVTNGHSGRTITPTSDPNAQYYDRRDEYTTTTQVTNDGWQDPLDSDTTGTRFKAGITTGTYTSHADYVDGLTSYTVSYNQNNFGDVISSVSETYYHDKTHSTNPGGIDYVTTENTDVIRGVWSSETYYKDDPEPFSYYPEDVIIDHTISDNTPEDIFEGGPDRTRTDYTYETITIGGQNFSAMYETSQNDSRNSVTRYKANPFIAGDPQERIIDFVESDSTDDDKFLSGLDKTKTQYSWGELAVTGDDGFIRIIEGLYSTEANDYRQTRTYFSDDPASRDPSVRRILYTIVDNPPEEVARGGPDQYTTNYYWRDPQPITGDPRGSTVSALWYTEAEDRLHTKVVYTDDPSEVDPRRTIYDYILNDNTPRALAGGRGLKSRTDYRYATVAETQGSVSKNVSVLDWTQTYDTDNPETKYDTSYYKDAPSGTRAADRVIDYRTNEKGYYTIHTVYEALERYGVTKDIISESRTYKPDVRGNTSMPPTGSGINGRLVSVTYYGPDFADWASPTSRQVSRVDNYHRDGINIHSHNDYEYQGSDGHMFRVTATKLDGTLRSVTQYKGPRDKELADWVENYNRSGVLDSTTQYVYKVDDSETPGDESFIKDTAVMIRASGTQTKMADLIYSGLADKEKLDRRISYEKDGQTIYGVTEFEYDATDGRMLTSTFEVPVGGGYIGGEYTTEVYSQLSLSTYKGDEGEEQVTSVENYVPLLGGGELLSTETYIYDDPDSFPGASTHSYMLL
ncbi:hypothetical protein ACFL5C_02805, partial [Candidatus Omnitrophota bacterium]